MKLGRFNKVLLTILITISVFSFAIPQKTYSTVTVPYTGSITTSGSPGATPVNTITPEYNPSYCGTDIGCHFRHLIGSGAASILQFGGDWILGGLGQMFDVVVDKTVVSLGRATALSSAVGLGVPATGGIAGHSIPGLWETGGFELLVTNLWKVFRDIGNIIIIFSLLYLAIRTILQGNGFAETKILSGILIAAVLINFSLFFTKIAFDVSNWTGVAVYNQIVGPGSEYQGATISEGVMRIINFQSVINNLENSGQQKMEIVWKNLGLALLMFILFLILAVIFFAAAMLLLIRFFIFIILMITSPIGLVAKYVPWLSGVGNKWWSELKKQTLVLPTFFLTLFVGLYATGIIFSTNQELSVSSSSSLATFLVSFVLAVVFLGFSLIAPGYVGAAGSKVMTGAANKLKGYGRSSLNWARKAGVRTTGAVTFGAGARLGRATLGRGANKFKSAKWLAKAANRGGITGATFKKIGRGLDNVSGASFDARNIKVGKKTIGESSGLGKGKTGGHKGVAEDKAKDLKKKYEQDMKVFENRWKDLDKEKQEEQKQKAINIQQTQLKPIENEITVLEQQRKAGERIDEDKYKELREQKKEIGDAISKLQKVEIKGNAEKVYAENMNKDRKSAWNKMMNVFTGGRLRAMKKTASDIEKGKVGKKKKQDKLIESLSELVEKEEKS